MVSISEYLLFNRITYTLAKLQKLKYWELTFIKTKNKFSVFQIGIFVLFNDLKNCDLQSFSVRFLVLMIIFNC